MAWNDFLKSTQGQGGPTSILDYGINTLANKFNNYAGSNRRLDYDQSLSDWGSTMGNVPDAPRMPPMLDPTGQMGASNYRAPQLNTLDPTWQHQLELQKRPAYQAPDERGFLGKTKDVIGNQISRVTTPIMGAMKRMVEPNTPEENFGLGYFQDGLSSSGRYQGNAATDVFGGGNVATGFGQGMGNRAQKRIDTIGNTIQRLTDLDEEKHRQTIRNLRHKQNTFQGQLDAYNTKLGAATGGADKVITADARTVSTGDGGRHDYARDRGGGYTLGGGFTGARGHHSRAEGGRIGYQEGELVEDESMMEATPAGMMEENIEEVQGEPSREQLEAIAFEIFQLPLEELNEEQLEVVYQAAMEQEPSEEEVQFAAQEGPGEGIASLV